MTREELRNAKAKLYEIITKEVSSYNGTKAEEREMYQYILELAALKIEQTKLD